MKRKEYINILETSFSLSGAAAPSRLNIECLEKFLTESSYVDSFEAITMTGLRIINDTTGSDCSMLYIYDKKTGLFSQTAMLSKNMKHTTDCTLDLNIIPDDIKSSDTFFSKILRDKTLLFSEDVKLETNLGFITKLNPKSFAAIPLIQPDGEINGIILILSTEQSYFKSQRGYLEVLAKHICVAIESSKLICGLHMVKQNIDYMLTELKNNQDKLTHNNRLAQLGKTAACVAHEIKQPLTAISFLTHGIEYTLKNFCYPSNCKIGPAQQNGIREDLAMINQQIQKIKQIIEHTRLYSKKDDEHQRAIININDCVSSAIKICRMSSKTQIDVFLNLQENLPEVGANYNEIEQVFTNLINNSIDALENTKKPYISIKTFSETKDGINIASVEIADNGKGIAKKNLKKIFQPFFSTKTDKEGTGLGLSIIDSIIKKHGGSISCQSQRYKGAVFTVSLPEVSNQTNIQED